MKTFKLLLLLVLFSLVYSQRVQDDAAPADDFDTDAPDTMVPAGGEITYLKEQLTELLTDPSLPTSARTILTDARDKNTIGEILAGIQTALTDPGLSVTQLEFLNRLLSSIATQQPTTAPSSPVPLTNVPEGLELIEMKNAINAVINSTTSTLQPATLTTLQAAVDNVGATTSTLGAAITAALNDPGLSANDRLLLLNALKSTTDAPATMSPGTVPTAVPADGVGEFLRSSIAQVLNDPTLPQSVRSILQNAVPTVEGYLDALRVASNDPNLTQAQRDELNRIINAAAGAETPQPTASPDDDDGLPWWLLLIPCALLFVMCLIALAVFMKRRTRDSFHDGIAGAIPPTNAEVPLPEADREISEVAFSPESQVGPTPAEPFVQTPPHPDVFDSAGIAAAAAAGPTLVASSPKWSTRGSYNPKVNNPTGPSSSPQSDRLRPLPEEDELLGGILGGVAFPGAPLKSTARSYPKHRPSPARTPGQQQDYYDHIEI